MEELPVKKGQVAKFDSEYERMMSSRADGNGSGRPEEIDFSR